MPTDEEKRQIEGQEIYRDEFRSYVEHREDLLTYLQHKKDFQGYLELKDSEKTKGKSLGQRVGAFLNTGAGLAVFGIIASLIGASANVVVQTWSEERSKQHEVRENIINTVDEIGARLSGLHSMSRDEFSRIPPPKRKEQLAALDRVLNYINRSPESYPTVINVHPEFKSNSLDALMYRYPPRSSLRYREYRGYLQTVNDLSEIVAKYRALLARSQNGSSILKRFWADVAETLEAMFNSLYR
jgi:hypothetical protein